VNDERDGEKVEEASMEDEGKREYYSYQIVRSVFGLCRWILLRVFLYSEE